MSPTVEFGSKALADEYREDYADHLCPDDDARLRTVRFTSDAPDWLLEQARLEADEDRAERETRSHSTQLGAGERERISDAGGFDGMATTFNWRSAKGVFAREGMSDKFADAIGSLADYDDPAEGAEEWIAQAKQADAQQGTQTASGGARDDGEQEIRQQRKVAEASQAAQSEQCDHARGHCRNGDPDACEFLTVACGLDEEEVEQMLDVDGDGQQAIEGKAAGALKRAWSGYKGSLPDLEEAIDDALTAWQHAQQAARAINEIRERHGQEAMHFRRLEELQAQLRDFERHAAADCHECHVGVDRVATLADHDHGGGPDDPSGQGGAVTAADETNQPGQQFPTPERSHA